MNAPTRTPAHETTHRLVRRGLTIAVIEGATVGGMFAAIEIWLVPLLTSWLGAADYLVFVLSIVPLLAAISTGPVVGHIITWLGGNKVTTAWCCAAQILCILALSIPLHHPHAPWSIPLALALASGVSVAGVVAGPAWMSWMGALIPRNLRGRYSSQRNRIYMTSKLAFAGLFAALVWSFPLASGPFALQVILVVGACSRMVSGTLLWLQPEVPPGRGRQQHPAMLAAAQPVPGFWAFVRAMPTTPFGRWTMVWALLNFGVHISASAFSQYMQTKLNGGLGLVDFPWTYTVLIQTTAIMRWLSWPAFGRLVDWFGPVAVLRTAVVAIAMLPLPWALTTSLPVLFGCEIVSGLAWCAGETAVAVLLFSAHHDTASRTRLIGYQATCNSAAMLVGSLIGMTLLKYQVLPDLLGSFYHTLFLISSGVRIPVLFLAIRMLPRTNRSGDIDHRTLLRTLPGAQFFAMLSREMMGFFRRQD